MNGETFKEFGGLSSKIKEGNKPVGNEKFQPNPLLEGRLIP